MTSPIYLDNAASAPLHPNIIPHLQSHLSSPEISLGNPSSLHSYGQSQQSILQQQREIFKKFTQASHVAWVSGGSEANAMALMAHLGVNSKPHGHGVTSSNPKKRHIIMGPVEHDSITKPIKHIFRLTHGFEVDHMKIDPKTGQIDLEHFKMLLRDETVLVVQMWVSNLFGTIFDVERIARIIAERAPKASFHIDGVQAFGKVPMDLSVFKRIGVRTTVAVSGHKVHALKGVGALLYSSYESWQKCKLPLIVGGGQEGGKRAGTENVLGILSFGLAAQEAQENFERNQAHFKELHRVLSERLAETSVVVHVDLPNTYSVVPILLPGAPAEVYFNHLMELNIATSTGSACQAKEKSIPHGYVSRGLAGDAGRRMLRVSFSSLTTVQEVEKFCDTLLLLVEKLAPSEKRSENYITAVEAAHSEDAANGHAEGDQNGAETKDSTTQDITTAAPMQDFHYKSVLVRWGELGLKGKNTKIFTCQLARNIRVALKPICKVDVSERNSRLFIELKNEDDYPQIPRIIDRLKDVFGIVSISPVVKVERNLPSIEQAVLWMARQELEDRSAANITFGVKLHIQKAAQRTTEDLSTQEYQAHLGSMIYELDRSRWTVKLRQPDVQFGVEIRTDSVYAYSKVIPGLGGLPAGVHGKALCLLSGGFDSSVAAWMMMKRGCSVHYISFWSYPYVGEKLVNKLKRLMKTLAKYNAGNPKMYLIHFTKIQESIRDHAPEPYRNILYRRAMNYVANFVANKINAHCLTTGESLGQVASQTVKNITCIQQTAKKVTFRPLIGFDKTEIIDIARRIGTNDISAEDAPDCCTLFQPAKPITHGLLEVCEEAEKEIPGYKDLIVEAYRSMQVLVIDEHTDLESLKLE